MEHYLFCSIYASLIPNGTVAFVFFWIPHIFNSHFNYLKTTRTLEKVKMLWEALSTMVHMQQFYRHYIHDEGMVMWEQCFFFFVSRTLFLYLLLCLEPVPSGDSKFKLQIIGGGQLHEVLEWFNYPLRAPTFEQRLASRATEFTCTIILPVLHFLPSEVSLVVEKNCIIQENKPTCSLIAKYPQHLSHAVCKFCTSSFVNKVKYTAVSFQN